MKIIEKWGTGIPKILRECREYGLPEPKLVDFDGDFRANMYRRAAMTKAQEIVRDDASAIWETTQTPQTPTQTSKENLTDYDKAIFVRRKERCICSLWHGINLTIAVSGSCLLPLIY